MTFREKYRSVDEWHHKAIIMSTYHLAMCLHEKGWTIRRTAKYFSVSIGLTSENLKLADAIIEDKTLIQTKTRQAALDKVNGR